MCQNHSFFWWIHFWATFIDIWWFLSGHTDLCLPKSVHKAIIFTFPKTSKKNKIWRRKFVSIQVKTNFISTGNCSRLKKKERWFRWAWNVSLRGHLNGQLAASFLYFCLFNTFESKQLFDKSLPMTGFEPQISGFEPRVRCDSLHFCYIKWLSAFESHCV